MNTTHKKPSQPLQKTVQAKPAIQPAKHGPIAQAAMKAAQPKMPNGVNRKPPVAPPVYRPQPVPKVLQTKASSVQIPNVAQPGRQALSSTVDRSQAKKIVQPKTISQRKASSTVPPAYHPEQRQAGPPSRQIPLRQQAVQCAFGSLGALPAEMYREIASRADQQSIENLRATNSTIREDLEDVSLERALQAGNLGLRYPVDEYNYKAICNRLAVMNGAPWHIPTFVTDGIRDDIEQFLGNHPGSDPSQRFWNHIRDNLGDVQKHRLLKDPQFMGLFGRASFLRRWGPTLLLGGAALAVGARLYTNQGRLF